MLQRYCFLPLCNLRMLAAYIIAFTLTLRSTYRCSHLSKNGGSKVVHLILYKYIQIDKFYSAKN